jgi:hypothetical protein
MESIAKNVRRERKQSKKGSIRKSLHEKSPSKAIDQAIHGLKGHWVHDVAVLFADCSKAVCKLEEILHQLKQQSGKSSRKNAKLGPNIRELVMFLKRWEALGDKKLSEQLVCPDEVEFHLECIRKYRKRSRHS